MVGLDLVCPCGSFVASNLFKISSYLPKEVLYSESWYHAAVTPQGQRPREVL